MYQKIIIAGNLGRDPEMRYTQNGKPVTNFSVAVNRQYTGADGQTVKETIWFRISAWGKLAETCNQYLRRGSKVLIEGRLNADPQTGGPRVYERQDGTCGASFEITANMVRFLSTRQDGGSSEEGADNGEGYAAPPVDDIPF